MRRLLAILIFGVLLTALAQREARPSRGGLGRRARELAEDLRLAVADGRQAAAERRAELDDELAARLAAAMRATARA